MSSRYERKVGPADVGQSIGMALQSFAEKLKLAQEKERIKQQGAFLTDFTTGILDPIITTQEELLPAAMERLAAAKRMGIDPSGGMNIFAQAFARLPSRFEKERQEAERERTTTVKKLGLGQMEEADRKTQYKEIVDTFMSGVTSSGTLPDVSEISPSVIERIKISFPNADPNEITPLVENYLSEKAEERRAVSQEGREAAQETRLTSTAALQKVKSLDPMGIYDQEMVTNLYQDAGVPVPMLEGKPIGTPEYAEAIIKRREEIAKRTHITIPKPPEGVDLNTEIPITLNGIPTRLTYREITRRIKEIQKKIDNYDFDPLDATAPEKAQLELSNYVNAINAFGQGARPPAITNPTPADTSGGNTEKNDFLKRIGVDQ